MKSVLFTFTRPVLIGGYTTVPKVSRVENSRLRAAYWPTVLVSLLALMPEFILSTSLGQARPVISSDFGAGASALVAAGSTFSTAALAVGAVIAADLAQRFRNRPLFLTYEGIFVAGSLMVALSPVAWVYAVGHVLQGLATGLLLVAALPPLITMFPTYRLKTTFPAVVMGLFGATTAGPMLGGLIAQTGAWRTLFWATVVIGAVTLVLAFVVQAERPALNPGMRFDAAALSLSVLGVGAAFFGVGQLGSHQWSSPLFLVPVIAGVGLITALVVIEARGSDPLMPASRLRTVFPIMGIIAAIVSGAAFTALVQLRIIFLGQVQGRDPLSVGLLFWPELLMAVIGALIVGVVLRTRLVLTLPVFGMLALAGAALLLTDANQSTSLGEILGISALLGLGASLTVTPGLLMAALSVVSAMVGRAIALVQLLRLSSAYLVAPVLVNFAMSYGIQSGGLTAGLHAMFWIVFAMLVGGLAIILLIFFSSGASLQPPGLEDFLERGSPALDSPPIGKAGKRQDPEKGAG